MSKAFSISRRIEVHKKYHGRCAYCGEHINYSEMHVDHIIPLQRGFTRHEANKHGIVKGSGRLDNLNPSCGSCNISKSTYSLEVWRQQLKLKIERLRKTVTNFRIVERYNLITVNDIEVKFYFEDF